MSRPEAVRLKSVSYLSPLPGFTVPGLGQLLRQNRFAVDQPYWAKVVLSGLFCIPNSLRADREQRLYGESIARTDVRAPLFILGHWRSGTTHLHNLLHLDGRFASPTAIHVLRPWTFLTTERRVAKLLGSKSPGTRLLDNIPFTLDAPQEDEIGLLFLTGLSPLASWVFPRRWDRYQKYLTLRGVSTEESRRWQAALVWFLRKVTLRFGGKSLVLKSPTHTARIRVLLDAFPDARFVHIHRDPYAVFRSSKHHHLVMSAFLGLQRPDPEKIEGRVLRHYRDMYRAFFEQRELIPAGHLHELSFEDLERDPLGEMERTYAALGLDGFRKQEPKLRRYIQSIAGYQKNAYPPLPPPVRARVAREWQLAFDAWGYPI